MPRPVIHPLLYEHRTRWVPVYPILPSTWLQIPGVVVCPVLTSTCLQSPVGSSVSRSAFQSFRHTTLLPCSCAGRDPCLPTTTTLGRVLLTNQAGSPAISGTQLVTYWKPVTENWLGFRKYWEHVLTKGVTNKQKYVISMKQRPSRIHGNIYCITMYPEKHT